MRIPHHQLLALAGLSTVGLASHVPLAYSHALDLAMNERPEKISAAGKYPLPGPQCDTWVGIEMIIMAEITEICPDGATVTETITECVETLTRSICATAATSLPCYPCVMSTLQTSDTATITRTSCTSATEETLTVTVQLCSTCTAATYVGTVPGYTPGGPCHGCSPYGSPLSTSASSSCVVEGEDNSAGQAATTTTTTTATSTSTSTVRTSGECGESDGADGVAVTSSPLSFSTRTHTHTHTHTPPYETTAAATGTAAATAGGVRNGVGAVMKGLVLLLLVGVVWGL